MPSTCSSRWMNVLLIAVSLQLSSNFAGAFQVAETFHRRHSHRTTMIQSIELSHQPRLPTFLQYSDPQQDSKVFTMEYHSQVSTTAPLSLTPLSREPILLVSSQPLLSADECRILQNHFQSEPSQHGDGLLKHVQSQIDELTDCPWHSGEAPVPRFLLYEKQAKSSYSKATTTTVSSVFPDGLHVDTNNGKYFRHVTCLLYLTTNDDGATSFPLANPGSSGSNDQLKDAAQVLLDSGVTHTLDKSQGDEITKLSAMLEDTGRDLLLNNDRERALSASPRGVRVLPRAGMLCVFCNLLENGMADPLSFHGGEASSDKEEKALLAFFKEIPMTSFSSQAELGKSAEKTRQYLLERYYENERE